MVFHQSVAPLGWTQLTGATYEDAGLRSTTGAVGVGGSDAFNTLFGAAKTASAHTLTATEMPVHLHAAGTLVNASHFHFLYVTDDTATGWKNALPAQSQISTGVDIFGDPAGGTEDTGTVQSTDSRTPTISGSTANAGSGSGHVHTLPNMDLKFVDVIVAEKK